MEISKTKLLFLLWVIVSGVIAGFAVATDVTLSWQTAFLLFFVIWFVALIPVFLLAIVFDETLLSKEEA